MDNVEDDREKRPAGPDEQSAESAFSGRKGGEDLAALSLQHPLESNYRPTNLITASEGAGAHTDAGRDGWRGNKHCRSFNNSQWVSTAGHWCYSATFYSRRGLSSTCSTPGPSFPLRNPKTDGQTSKRLQCDRITRCFHVRWLNWNATGDLRDERWLELERRKQTTIGLLASRALASRLIWFVRSINTRRRHKLRQPYVRKMLTNDK